MPSLAREVKRLIPLDPEFVEDLYKKVFAHREKSQESTFIGRSNILPLRSNRQQDYNMAPYALAEVFLEFLSYAPRKATSALIVVMESYVAHEHASVLREIIEESFDFNGTVAWICTDYSSIWDTGSTYQHRDALKLLNTFEQYLQHLAEQEKCAGALHDLVE